MSGAQDIVVAAGVESMTRVPMGLVANVLPRKNGLGFYMSDALSKKYDGVEFSQFMGAEMMAKKYDITQEDLSNFSLESHLRAAKATAGELTICNFLRRIFHCVAVQMAFSRTRSCHSKPKFITPRRIR